MNLSCTCDYIDYFDWYYYSPADYSTYLFKRGRRCTSCDAMIHKGDCVAEFTRDRKARSDIEKSIYGWNCIPLASFYLCEVCADLYFSLAELGFECISPQENMRHLVNEYTETYGPARRRRERARGGDLI